MRGWGNTVALRAEDVSPVTARRFWGRTRPVGECQAWAGGRGVNWKGGAGYTPAKVAYALAYGEVPAGRVVLTTCGTPGCVLPAHLDCLTVAEATRRWGAANRKLTPAKARQVRELLASGSSLKEVAARFGISTGHAQGIWMNEVWYDPDWVRPVRRTVFRRKLSPGQVLECQRRAAAGESIRSLAREAGVAESTMWYAVNGPRGPRR